MTANRRTDKAGPEQSIPKPASCFRASTGLLPINNSMPVSEVYLPSISHEINKEHGRFLST